jgi:two-component system cell cycle response regulator
MSRARGRSGETEKRKPRVRDPDDPSGIASFLLERRDVLDRTLRQQDRSAMAAILNRTPPAPLALVAIDNESVRERMVRLLRNANIELTVAAEEHLALTQLECDTHAVVFTDRIPIIRGARDLPAGAATHVVFVNHLDAGEVSEAWQAGANDCMPAQPGGEEFWAHLTTARRIIGLAGLLKLALTDNRILSTLDALTGCGSQRFFGREFPRELERAVRLDRPLSLVMCDIDHFKRVNDEYGHQVGDEVLIECADRLTQGLRLGLDWLARVGGEEFAAVLPETTEEEALRIAERLRARVATLPFDTHAGRIVVTASFGVRGIRGRQPRSSASGSTLIRAADKALYQSKRSGRNRVSGRAASKSTSTIDGSCAKQYPSS